ncbi:MAG TPA: protease complex subunit PrcB family protein [Caulobacteraceae bacterium]
MRGLCLIVAMAAGLIALTNHRAEAAAPSERAIVPLGAWYGQYSGDGEREFIVVHSSRQFAVLAASLPAGRALPSFDEAKETALAVYLGQRPTGGYGVRLISAQVEAGVMRVHVAERRPPPDSFTTQALTTPFAIFVFAGPSQKIDVLWDTDER